MNTYIIKEGQTLLDLAVQLYGSVDYLVKLCIYNSLDLNFEPVGGTELLVDTALFNLFPTSNYFYLNDRCISTAGTLEVEPGVHSIEHSTEYNYLEYN